ncbi:hypothetical protein B0O80DRAFT_218596 [Mortierella sp. GBAus27b]|nr:hypothetical protein B0O80DRAFT_218596 [Mortierella sp. GBAus27b]
MRVFTFLCRRSTGQKRPHSRSRCRTKKEGAGVGCPSQPHAAGDTHIHTYVPIAVAADALTRLLGPPYGKKGSDVCVHVCCPNVHPSFPGCTSCHEILLRPPWSSPSSAESPVVPPMHRHCHLSSSPPPPVLHLLSVCCLLRSLSCTTTLCGLHESHGHSLACPVVSLFLPHITHTLSHSLSLSPSPNCLLLSPLHARSFSHPLFADTLHLHLCCCLGPSSLFRVLTTPSDAYVRSAAHTARRSNSNTPRDSDAVQIRGEARENRPGSRIQRASLHPDKTPSPSSPSTLLFHRGLIDDPTDR